MKKNLRILIKAWNLILDLFIPYYCANCKKLGKPLCSDCDQLIEYNLEEYPEKISNINKIFAATHYTSVMENLITEYKFRFVKTISRNLAQIIFTSMLKNKTSEFLERDIILVPVPLSNKRKRWRGFNQADEVCKEISKVTNQKVLNLILKNKNTKPQSELNKEERNSNLENSFSLNYQTKVSFSSRICIVDDVITTGSTIKNIADILNKAGYKNLYVLVLSF